MQTDSIFIIHSDKHFRREVLESSLPVFVEFSADWCGSCYINAPVLREMAEKFRARIKFCQIDIDTHEDIAKRYGVQKIPTMFFFRDGQVVDYMVGIIPKTVLVQKLETLL